MVLNRNYDSVSTFMQEENKYLIKKYEIISVIQIINLIKKFFKKTAAEQIKNIKEIKK
jgi:hypothetical protein